MDGREIIIAALEKACAKKTLKKAVLSMPANKSVKRAQCRLTEIAGGLCVQIETFMTDGKALHENIPVSEAPRIITERFTEG